MAALALRKARAAELPDLSRLCLRSKAHWGYDKDFLAACREELTLRPHDLESTYVAVAVRAGQALGVAQFNVKDETADVLKLFVDPDHIGAGVGRTLFAWMADAARRAGTGRMTIEADPQAAPFYVRMGARRIGAAPSGSIPGRMLPVLELPLT